MYQGSGQGTYVPTMVPPPGYAAQMQTMSGGQVAGVYDNSAMMGMQVNQQAAYMHPQQMMWGAQVAGNYLAGSTGAVAEAESDPDMYETCVYLGVEDVDGFNVRSRVIGEKGENLEYMRRNTSAKVLLRGKGSGVHNNKPLHIFISHHTLQGMQETEKLANNLVKVIKEEHADFLAKNADQVFKKSGSSSQRDSYSGSNSNRSYGNGRSTSYQQPNIMQQQSMVYSNMHSNDASHGGNQVGGGMVFEYGHSRSSSDDRNQTRNQNQNQGFIQRGMQDTNDRNRNQNQGFNQRGMQDTSDRNRNQNQGFNQRGMQDTRGQSSFSSRSRFDSGGDNFERNRTTNHRDQSSRSSQLSRSSYLDDSSGSRSYNRDRGTSSYTAGRTTQSHYCDVCSIDCPTRQMYNQHCKGAMHKEKEEAMMKQLRSPPRGRSFSKDLEGTHWEGPPEPTSSRTERNRQKTESKRDHDTDKTLEDWVFQECEKRVKLMIGEGPLNHLKRMVEKIGQRDLKSALPAKAQSDDYCKLCKMDVTDMKQHLTVKSHGSLYLLRQIQLGELFMEYYSDVPIPGVITDGGRVLAMDTLSFGPCIPETNRNPPKIVMNRVTRFLIIGDDHVVSLSSFINSPPAEYANSVLADWHLEDPVTLHGVPGRTVKAIKEHDLEKVNELIPHVIILLVGGNDLGDTKVCPVDLACRMKRLAVRLINTVNCYVVFVCSVPLRKNSLGLSPEYTFKVMDCNKYLAKILKDEKDIFYKKLQGLYAANQETLQDDGIHLNQRGLYKVYRAIRGAMIKGLDYMDTLRGVPVITQHDSLV